MKLFFSLIMILFVSIFFTACIHTNGGSHNPDPKSQELPIYVPGYYAIDPIVLENQPNTKDNKEPDDDLLNLYNIGSRSTQYQVSAQGEVRYLSSGSQAKSGSFFVTVDHLVHTPMELILNLEMEDKTKIDVPVGLVLGVAIRIIAKASAAEGEFNLADIPGLNASAAASKSTADIELEIIGIRNETIVKLPRFIGNLNVNTLQTLLQNTATVNAEIYGDNTEIVPQIIGVDIKSLPQGIELYHIVEALRRWKLERASTKRGLKITDLSGAVDAFTYKIPKR